MAIPRGLWQSLGYILMALGLLRPCVSFRAAFPAHTGDHGERGKQSGWARQVGWEMQVNVTSNSPAHVTSTRMFCFQRMRSAEHRNACCLPRTLFAAGPVFLRGKHLLSTPSAEGRPGSLGRTALLISSAGQGDKGPLQGLGGGAPRRNPLLHPPSGHHLRGRPQHI